MMSAVVGPDRYIQCGNWEHNNGVMIEAAE